MRRPRGGIFGEVPNFEVIVGRLCVPLGHLNLVIYSRSV